jgi:hypothetical protein
MLAGVGGLRPFPGKLSPEILKLIALRVRVVKLDYNQRQ